jgi:4-hydroxy-4-methyl-2-oxoglutarate aldolase
MVAASPGDVLVVDGGETSLALAGELVTRTAEIRGLGGIVVDGGYRDMTYVASTDFPVFSRHVSPMAADTRQLGELQVAVTCGGVTIRPGDLVVSDREGIVVIDSTVALATLDAAFRVKTIEQDAIAQFDQARQMADLLNFREHSRLLEEGRLSTLHFERTDEDHGALPLAGNG